MTRQSTEHHDVVELARVPRVDPALWLGYRLRLRTERLADAAGSDDVAARLGAALAERLRSRRTLRPDVTALGLESEPYAEELATLRPVYEALAADHWPAMIVTGSPRVAADVASLVAAHRASYAAVVLRVPGHDGGATAPLWEAARALASAGVPVGAYLGEQFCEEALPSEVRTRLLGEAKAAGAGFVLLEAPGSTKLYETVAEAGCTATVRAAARAVREAGLSLAAPRWIPNDYRQINFLVAEVLMNEARELLLSGERYKNLYWAAVNVNAAPESVALLAARGAVGEIRNVHGWLARRITDELVPRFTRNNPFFEQLKREAARRERLRDTHDD